MTRHWSQRFEFTFERQSDERWPPLRVYSIDAETHGVYLALDQSLGKPADKIVRRIETVGEETGRDLPISVAVEGRFDNDGFIQTYVPEEWARK